MDNEMQYGIAENPFSYEWDFIFIIIINLFGEGFDYGILVSVWNLTKTSCGFDTLMGRHIAAHEVPATGCGNWLFQAAVHIGCINFTATGQESKLYSLIQIVLDIN